MPGTSGGGGDAFAVTGPAVGGEGGTGADQITNIGIPGGRGGGAYTSWAAAKGGNGGNGARAPVPTATWSPGWSTECSVASPRAAAAATEALASAPSAAAQAAEAAPAVHLMARMAVTGLGSALPLPRSGALARHCAWSAHPGGDAQCFVRRDRTATESSLSCSRVPGATADPVP